MVILAPRNPYAEAARLVEHLPRDLAAARQRLRCSVTSQAKAIGVSAATLTAVYAGKTPTRKTILLALHWLSKH